MILHFATIFQSVFLYHMIGQTSAQNTGISLIFDAPLTAYSVMESTGQLTVCVRAEGGVINSDFNIIFTVTQDSAKAGADYSVSSPTTFSYTRSSPLTRCIMINIIQDGIVENIEFFNITISASDPTVNISTRTILAAITDSDRVEISPDMESYEVEEGAQVRVCAVLRGNITRSVSYSLNTISGTATNFADYLGTSVRNSFEVNGPTENCVNFVVFDDQIIEPTEQFVVTVSNTVSVIGGQAAINIIDNDGASVALWDRETSIVEGNRGTSEINICVHLINIRSGLGRDVQLLLSTSDVTANENDYEQFINKLLIIPMGSAINENICTSVRVRGDQIRENNETFTVRFQASNPLDIIEGSNTLTVTILDDGDVIADCGVLNNLPNGEVSFSNTTQGAVALYSCNIGRVVTGNSTRTCQQSGNWSGLEPTCEFVNCGDPSHIPSNGSVAFSATLFQSTANYSCTTGYLINGPEERSCQANGSWSGEDPFCQIVDCGSLPSPFNGHIIFTMGTVFSSTAMYQCDNGYEPNGIPSRTCLATGQWSLSPPTCQRVVCPTLDDPNDGRVVLSGSSATFMSNATYSCNERFILIGGDDVRTCQANRTWSGSEPTCIANCGNLDQPLFGMVTQTGTTEGSMATYNCTEGYTLEMGDISRTCAPNGSWTGQAPICQILDCGPLVAPSGGRIEINTTTFHSTAQFSCNNGYTFSGDESRVCNSNGWSGSQPTCTIVDCGTLLDPENGNVDLSQGTEFGSRAIYSCVVGHGFNGERMRVCQANGNWSGSSPTCEPGDCGTLGSPDNGVISLTGTTFSSRALYNCSHGYVLNGTAIRTCQANMSWSGEEPLCEPVDCGRLRNLSNGVVRFKDTFLRENASYECYNGYNLIGARVRTCTEEGEWSGVEPCCQVVDCGTNFAVPPEGNANLQDTTFMSILTYTCQTGYTILGISIRQCLASGQWSGAAPTCEDIDECSSRNGGCSQLCNNTQGSFQCSCQEGFMLSEDGSTCNDIDECSLDRHNCHSLATCTNNEGSFSCSCNPGYEGDGIGLCQDLDECQRNEDECDSNAECMNTIGSFRCLCNSGYVGSGSTCLNIDECTLDSHDCDSNAECLDTPGSFTCTCSTGFIGNGTSCTETCSSYFQLLLSDVGVCSQWRFVQPQEKLAELASFVHTTISAICQCNLPPSSISGGEFSCPTSNSQEVLYRARLRGIRLDDCGALVNILAATVQSNQASVRVLGNRLTISPNCDIRVTSLGSDLMCHTPAPATTTVAAATNELISGTAIGGGVAGGVIAIVVIVVVVILIALVFLFRKRSKTIMKEPPVELIPTTSNKSYSHGGLPPVPNAAEEHVYSTVDEFRYNTGSSSFNPNANVLPKLGTLQSSRYVRSPQLRKPELVAVSVPVPGSKKEEEFYDEVYDDFKEVEELYDPIETNLIEDESDPPKTTSSAVSGGESPGVIEGEEEGGACSTRDNPQEGGACSNRDNFQGAEESEVSSSTCDQSNGNVGSGINNPMYDISKH